MLKLSFVFARFVLFLFLLFSFCASVQGFFEIIEVMPNTLDDKNLEYITLKNISDSPQSLSGYILADKKKEYLIEEEILLEADEENQFLRPETKLVLNNTNEEVRLISPSGEVVDQVEYEKSIKGEALHFEDIIEEKEILEQEIVSEEASLEIISDEAPIELLDADESGNNNEEEDIEEVNLLVPKVIFSFQRPSYMTQSGSSDIYICDSDRDECKVNFDLRSSFSSKLPERDYICNIDFGFNGFEAQEGRCNPNTVIFPVGQHEVVFSIFHEDDLSVFSQKTISVVNAPVSLVDPERLGEDSASSLDVEIFDAEVSVEQGDNDETTQELNIGTIFKIPEVTFEFQRPSYALYSEDENSYVCDSEHDECKINFDLRGSFTDELPERDYRCEIDFGIGALTGEESKCNPNTVVFPEGEFDLSFRIYHEDSDHMFSQKVIYVSHQEEAQEVLSSAISGGSSSSSSGAGGGGSSSKIHIVSPKIIVQSGLEGSGRYFYCKKSECKINLNYEKKHKDERCLWNFGSGIAGSKTTHKRCNPGYVSFEKGVHELSLRVYEKNNESNEKKYIFYVYNKEVTLQNKENNVNNNIIKNEGPKENILGRKGEDEIIHTKILLQGKLGKEKVILSENSLECSGVETCYVNLTSEITGNSKGLEYKWFNNSELFSEKQNPKGIWLNEEYHTIVFQVLSNGELISENKYFVSVNSDKNTKEDDIGEEISPDQSNADPENTLSKTALKKIFTQNFLVLKYDGLRISGKAPIGSLVEIYHKGEKILEGESDENGKYRVVSSEFEAGEYIFDTKIIYPDSKELYIENSGEFEILGEKIQNWLSEDEKQKQTSKTALKKIFTQNFLVLKYDGLRISGKAPVLSRVEIYLNGKKILSGIGDQKGKYRIVTKNLKAGKYSFDTKIIYPNGEELYIENSGEFELLAVKMGNWYTQKKSSSSGKKSSSLKFPKLILEAYAGSSDEGGIIDIPLHRKIIIIAGLSLIMLLALVSIIFRSLVPVKLFVLESQKLAFGVREKVCLLV